MAGLESSQGLPHSRVLLLDVGYPLEPQLGLLECLHSGLRVVLTSLSMGAGFLKQVSQTTESGDCWFLNDKDSLTKL